MAKTLTQVAMELRAAADKTNGMLRVNMGLAALPAAQAVRARILAIPVKGEVPYHQPPGLRLRIAGCVRTWTQEKGDFIQAGVEIDASRMPSGQYSLPLGMEGAKAWWHPVFGDRVPGVTQEPHPYFYDSASIIIPDERQAIEGVVNAISAELNKD